MLSICAIWVSRNDTKCRYILFPDENTVRKRSRSVLVLQATWMGSGRRYTVHEIFRLMLFADRAPWEWISSSYHQWRGIKKILPDLRSPLKIWTLSCILCTFYLACCGLSRNTTYPRRMVCAFCKFIMVWCNRCYAYLSGLLHWTNVWRMYLNEPKQKRHNKTVRIFTWNILYCGSSGNAIVTRSTMLW